MDAAALAAAAALAPPAAAAAAPAVVAGGPGAGGGLLPADDVVELMNTAWEAASWVPLSAVLFEAACRALGCWEEGTLAAAQTATVRDIGSLFPETVAQVTWQLRMPIPGAVAPALNTRPAFPVESQRLQLWYRVCRKRLGMEDLDPNALYTASLRASAAVAKGISPHPSVASPPGGLGGIGCGLDRRDVVPTAQALSDPGSR